MDLYKICSPSSSSSLINTNNPNGVYNTSISSSSTSTNSTNNMTNSQSDYYSLFGGNANATSTNTLTTSASISSFFGLNDGYNSTRNSFNLGNQLTDVNNNSMSTSSLSTIETSSNNNSNCDRKKLFIGNLPSNTTIEELVELFSQYGRVNEKLSVVKDDNYAFIHFYSEKDAEVAQFMVNDSLFKNRYIRVQYSVSNGHIKKPKTFDMVRSTSLYLNDMKKSKTMLGGLSNQALNESTSSLCMPNQAQTQRYHQNLPLTKSTTMNNINSTWNGNNDRSNASQLALQSIYLQNSQSVISINNNSNNINNNKAIRRPIRGSSSVVGSLNACQNENQQWPSYKHNLQLNQMNESNMDLSLSILMLKNQLEQQQQMQLNQNNLHQSHQNLNWLSQVESKSLLIPANSEINKQFQLQQLSLSYKLQQQQQQHQYQQQSDMKLAANGSTETQNNYIFSNLF